MTGVIDKRRSQRSAGIRDSAQQKSITGLVTDAETGETLIGVNVTLGSDASQGTVTDIDGRY